MRPRSVIPAVVTVLIIAGAMYYFYGYRDRDISSDFNAAKNYTEDASTTAAVKSALALNKQVAALDIHVVSSNNVDTKDNNVTLTGQVPTEVEKRVAEEIARGTRGVANVVNNIEVAPQLQASDPEKHPVADLEIKTAVLQSILNNPSLKSQQIKVDVYNGEVTLTGSVQTPTQKTDAESAARAVANVRDVDSNALGVTKSGEGQP